MDRKIQIKSLNCFITCNICKGYLVGATAITECLHTFCKSCLIKHLEVNTTCPTCKILIHHSYPRQYIKFDRTLQDIVYKLVPGLLENEREREREFYRQRGLPYPVDIPSNEDSREEESSSDYNDYYPNEEYINLCLQCKSTNSFSSFDKKFIRVTTKTTVKHLKKFIACNVFKNVGLFRDVNIFCNCDELLDERDNMKFVYLSKWRNEDVPLLLQFELTFRG